MKVYNIVFLDRDCNVHQMHKDLNRSLPRSERCQHICDFSDKQIVDCLMQWHMESHLDFYDCSEQSYADLDSNFLGYRIDQTDDAEGYLLSRNDGLGYYGLSYFVAKMSICYQ